MNERMDVERLHERTRSFGLRYWILGLISQKETTGASIIDGMERMSFGRWRPSPGSVYPLLNNLTKKGLLKIKLKNNMKYYSLTKKGKTELNSNWISKLMKKSVLRPSRDTLNETLDLVDYYCDYMVEKQNELEFSASGRKKINHIINKLKTLGETHG